MKAQPKKVPRAHFADCCRETSFLSSFPQMDPNPVLEVDLQGVITYANPAAQKLFPHLLKLGCDDAFLQGWPSVAELCTSGSKLPIREVPVEDRWYQQSMYFLPQDKRVRIYGLDITDQKLARAQALQGAEKCTSELLESIADGFVSMNGNLVLTCFNSAAERIFGRKSSEVLGKQFFDAFPQARRSALDGFCQQALAGKAPMSIETYFDIEPHKGWYVVRTYPKEDGISVVFQNITARKQTEETLQQRIDELASINSLSNRVSTTLSVDQVAAAGLEGIHSAVHPDVAFIFLREGDRLILKGLLPQSARRELDLPEHRVGECMCGLSVRQNKALYSINIFNDIRCTWDECRKAGIVSFASLPLRDAGQVIGVIGLGTRTQRDFHRQASFLDTLASQISVAFTNARLFSQVQLELAERRRAEESVRAGEERLRQAVRVAGLGIFDHDHLTNIINWSREMLMMCGFKADQVITLEDWMQCVHPEDRARIADDIRAAHDPAGGGLYAVEHRFLGPDGQLRWLSIRSQTFFEGSGAARRAVRTIGAVLDITESRRVHEALRRKSEELERYFESALDLLCIASVDGRLLKVNPEWQHALGYSRKELEGSCFMDLVHVDDRAATADAMKRLSEHRKIFKFINRFRHRDGTHRWLEWRSQLVDDFIYSVARDITDRKRSEESLRKYSSDLEQSNRDLEQFAYIASHDLQEPLRMVTSFMSLLKEQYAVSLDEQAREYIDFAFEGGTRMKALIDGLLEYSRIKTRAQPPLDADSQAALDAAIANLDQCITDAHAVISHDPMPTVRADAVQLTQLFQNLLSNAIKFRGERPPEIHVGAREQEGNWLLWVKDNGIGIDQRFQDRVFQLFHRLHTQERFPGTGIGLAICKKIVDRHGGRIWVESAPGAGSTFYFTIPRQ